MISSDKADSDLCSYKIWMKEKVQEEVSRLEEYYGRIEEKFEKKSQDMVQVTNEKRKITAKTKESEDKYCELKGKLK